MTTKSKVKCELCDEEENLILTDCCKNWVCNDEDQLATFSISINQCYQNHFKNTLCGFHYREGHKEPNWKTCQQCKDYFSPEEYCYFSTNSNNFDITRCTAAAEAPHIVHKTKLYCMKCWIPEEILSGDRKENIIDGISPMKKSLQKTRTDTLEQWSFYKEGNQLQSRSQSIRASQSIVEEKKLPDFSQNSSIKSPGDKRHKSLDSRFSAIEKASIENEQKELGNESESKEKNQKRASTTNRARSSQSKSSLGEGIGQEIRGSTTTSRRSSTRIKRKTESQLLVKDSNGKTNVNSTKKVKLSQDAPDISQSAEKVKIDLGDLSQKDKGKKRKVENKKNV